MIDQLARRYGVTPDELINREPWKLNLMLACAQAGADAERRELDRMKRGNY